MDVVAHVVFLVKDLVVDSINGYLYWATMYSVEGARLNGEEYLVLQEQLQFSGKQVTDFFFSVADVWLDLLNIVSVHGCQDHCVMTRKITCLQYCYIKNRIRILVTEVPKLWPVILKSDHCNKM